MFTLYDRLKSKSDELARPRKPESLVKGRAYPICHVEKRKSKFSEGDTEVFNLIVHYMDGNLKFSSFMPKKFNDMSDEDIATLRKDINSKRPCKLVYYGNINISREMDIIPFDEEPDQGKLEAIALIAANEAETDDPPRKRQRSGDSSLNSSFESTN